MKIAMINASPKAKNSASEFLLDSFGHYLSGHTKVQITLRTHELQKEDINQMMQCDIWVIAFPLYVDALPSHLLSCLLELEQQMRQYRKKIILYALVNSGFYEAHQNIWALAVLKNWCKRAGIAWGQGMAVGGGGMLPGVKNVPIGHGPLKNLGNAMKQMAQQVLQREAGDDILVKPNFPRFLYRRIADWGWTQQIKKNGGRTRDLGRKL